MKPIKFDLKLNNGTITLATLDDLEENLSPELFTHFHSGKLAKWLKVRKLDELAEKVDALRAQHLVDKNELDVKLFKSLCEIFVSEISEDDAREAIAEFHALPVVETESEEIEESKSLMVIEQPKTKEFRVNERLLYKTFMELGGEIKNEYSSQINYAKGETQPSKTLLELLEKYAINIDDVVICVKDNGWMGSWFILTNNCFVFDNNTSLVKNSFFCCPNCRISLSDIFYLNSGYNLEYDEFLLMINHTICQFPNSFSPIYPFLKDYLALEEFEDKFEPLIKAK